MSANQCTILPGMSTASGESPDTAEYRGWLLKWTNYIKGYRQRWFVLSDGLLSYYRLEEGYILNATFTNSCTGVVQYWDFVNYLKSRDAPSLGLVILRLSINNAKPVNLWDCKIIMSPQSSEYNDAIFKYVLFTLLGSQLELHVNPWIFLSTETPTYSNFRLSCNHTLILQTL